MLNHKVKYTVNFITAIALAILIFSSRSQILDAIRDLSGVNLGLLALILPLQLGSYASLAKVYQTYFRDTGQKTHDLPYKELLKVALEVNFINRVLPSGGLSGFSYVGLRLRPFGLRVASATLAQIVLQILVFVTFLPILAIGLFMLAAGNQANGLTILIGTSIFITIIIGTLLGIFIISDESRIKSFLAFLPKVVNLIVRNLRINKELLNIKKIEAGLGEMHRLYVELASEYKQLKKPLLWALASNLFELATLYFVYVAFGEFINPGAIILAYAVANFAALVAILPGGIGVYESLMTYILAVSGVARGLAISTTLIYRIINLSVFVPVGYYFYNKALNNKTRKAEQ